jgi:DNA-binding NtrC family response regulator
MTAYGKIESAVQAIRFGAVDYIEKPMGMDKLRRQIREWFTMQGANPAESPAYRKIVGESPQLRGVWQLIKKFAPSDMTILLEGESGTGKEIFAWAIHEFSKRRHGPFVPLDCASLPNSIIESEIFGYERGAFTGATQSKVGRLEWANERTLFLDEGANIPLDIQGKLLRVLQEREFSPLGAHRPQRIALDVRIVGASNRPLMAMVHGGHFREDLYYRLSAVSFHIPALRERTGDVERLAAHFLQSDAEHYGKPCPALTPEALAMLTRYPWPGNVRELENVIKSAALLAEDIILPDHLPIHLRAASPVANGERDDRTRLHLEVGVELADTMDLKVFRISVADAAEKELITRVTQVDRLKQFELAAFLNIDPKTLRSKLKRYGLSQEEQVHGGKDPGSRRSG